MKKILIVDDDAVTLSMLSGGLKSYDDYEILTAENGKVAARLLNVLKIDLVITDLKMPEMDGFQLLLYMHEKYPEVPVIVMTAYGTPNIKSKVTTLGSSYYFEKPIDMKLLTDRITDELGSGATGEIHGISLASFLQLVEMEKKTCTLTIKAGENDGKIYFQKGDIIFAETGSLVKEKAAYEIISWDNSSIEIENTCRKKVKEIKSPLMHILMESLKQKDDRDTEEFNDTLLEMKEIADEILEETVDTVDEEIDAFMESAEEEISAASGISEPEIQNNLSAEPSDTLDANAKRLSELMMKESGIYDFGIFDATDSIKNKTFKTGSIIELVPSLYMSLTKQLKEHLGSGDLKYIVIKTKPGIRYSVFKHGTNNVIVALKPGLKPSDFMRKLDRK